MYRSFLQTVKLRSNLLIPISGVTNIEVFLMGLHAMGSFGHFLGSRIARRHPSPRATSPRRDARPEP
jgi:hypothetical protein